VLGYLLPDMELFRRYERGGILIGKLKQIKTKTRRKLKDIWDFFLYFLVQRMSKFPEIHAKFNSFEQLSEFSWNSGKIP
jgi:hypothetical protein